MLRYSLNVSLEDHKPNEEITAEARVMPIKNLIRKRWLQWYGHVRRRERPRRPASSMHYGL